MKILVSDFDHTFYRDEYLNNIKLVNEFVKQGNMFIIATGRNINSLLQKTEEHNINYKYLICNDGGTTFDHKLNVINRIDIEAKTAKEIFNILKEDPAIEECYVDDSLNLNMHCDCQANGIVGHYTDAVAASVILNKILNKYPNVMGYLSENWVNITDISTSKGNAINWLISEYNLNPSDIYVVGDNINDLSMLKLFKGYAMEDGLDELKLSSVKTIKTFSEVIDIIYEDIYK